ncbi:hypothetical protein CC86DRAFT_401286 [Ophiobolus disseminans]|uniref:F-box domain-containing protein n=1 Tax=Ophiobolus disseminans TaxID=1469910 RepID=A0A6A7AIM3_9PLEO|nr:hypothetical protein CC86DRAFT_401286 [Ophiobolus disseminans]
MASINPDKPKGLLDLPKEIRNRVYAAAVAGDDFDVRLIGLAPSKLPKPSRALFCPPNWNTSRRPFLGLTQVCQQLRAEFLPIYYRYIKVSVPYMDVYRYGDTFMLYDKAHPIEQCNVRILREPGYLCRYAPTVGSFDIDIDIAPLLRLYKKTPGLELELNSYHHLNNELRSLLDRDNTIWWDYVHKAVSRILYPGLEIRIKPEYKEEWMKLD